MAASSLPSRLATVLPLEQVSKIANHKGCRIILGGWTFFTLENLILSHNRSQIIETFSERAYHTGYNTLSSAACLSIAYGYFKHGRRQGPILWGVTPQLRAASAVFTGLGLIGFAQVMPHFRNPVEMLAAMRAGSGGKSLCPMDFEADKAAAAKEGPYGMSRVTRHASLWSFAFLSFGMGALRTVFAAEFCLFATPLAVIGILAAHKDHRYRRGVGGEMLPAFEWPYSSNIPFAACAFGQSKLYECITELKPTNSLIALGVTAGMALRRIKGVV